MILDTGTGTASEPGVNPEGPPDAAGVIHVNRGVGENIHFALDDNQPRRIAAIIKLPAIHNQSGIIIGADGEIGLETDFSLGSV